MSSSLDPDHVRWLVWPDLGPNELQRLLVDDTSTFVHVPVCILYSYYTFQTKVINVRADCAHVHVYTLVYALVCIQQDSQVLSIMYIRFNSPNTPVTLKYRPKLLSLHLMVHNHKYPLFLTFDVYLGVKVTQNVDHYPRPLHLVTYVLAKFEVLCQMVKEEMHLQNT